MPSPRLSNYAKDTATTFKRVLNSRTGSNAYWLGQLITPKVPEFGYFIVRSPSRSANDFRPKGEHQVVLPRLGIDAKQFAGLNLKSALLQHLTSQRIKRRFARLNTPTGSRPSFHRVVRAHTQNASGLVEDRGKDAKGPRMCN